MSHFDIKCYTQTFIGKPCGNYQSTIDNLLQFLPGSYKTKFRNCVLKKIDKKNIKLYTNFTIQTSGFLDTDLISILNTIKAEKDYTFKCVMCNWSLKLADKIDLKSAIKVLNSGKIISYFLRGYPLVIKYKTTTNLNTYKFIWDNLNKTYHKSTSSGVFDVKVSVLLFKTGTCIVSGPSEECCFECVEYIKTKIF